MARRALRYGSEGHREDLAYLIAHFTSDPKAAEFVLDDDQEHAAVPRAGAGRMNAALERRAQAQVDEATSYGQLQVQKLESIETRRRIRRRRTEL